MFYELFVTQYQIMAEALPAEPWFQHIIKQQYQKLNKLRKLCIASGQVQCKMCFKSEV